ncbi:MAG TPA: HipA domain-containing protein [Nocardioidaceae bacterium]|nr:HipA domain-containing protein [Nocardioidaceae bacterium]
MSRDPLDVWLYGTRIAHLQEDAQDRISLIWTAEAEERWGHGARMLSAKLAVGSTPAPALVRTYLDGLLPEGNTRVNHAMTAGVPPDDTYALVRAYGRDTPGAAIFVSAGTPDPTRAGRYVPLTDQEVADRLRRADEHQSASPKQTTESSTLPGMVPKITLHRISGRWQACKEGAPSTWILKRADAQDGGIADIVDTEVACLALARQMGLTSIDAELLDFGDVRAIAVSRYDRDPSRHNARVHQEDLAQAVGLNTADPNRKFQWGARMPSLAQAAQVLLLDGGNPDHLLRLLTFSLLVGNTDLHAKNISFLRYADGRVALSPAYDIAMHLHHPRDNRRFALDVNGRFRMEDLDVGDVVAEAGKWGVPSRRASRVVTETTRALDDALGKLDRSAHPGVTPQAWGLVEQRTTTALTSLAAPDPSRASTAGAPEGAPGRRRGPRRPR